MNKEVLDLFSAIAKDNIVCKQGMEWVSDCNSLEDVWNLCPRADWMLLNISRMGYSNNKALRKFIYRVLTEVKVKDGLTIERLANPSMRKYIGALHLFVLERITEDDFENVTSRAWAFEKDKDDDINLIVATACSWPKGNGSMMAAKAIVNRMNAITDNEDTIEKQEADILRDCASYDEVYQCSRVYIDSQKEVNDEL